MNRVQEAFTPAKIAANGSLVVPGKIIAGFLASATGTIAVTDPDGNSVIGTTAVTAGIYTPLPMLFGKNGATITLASSGAGTLFYL